SPVRPSPDAPVVRPWIVRAAHRLAATRLGGRALVAAVTPLDRWLMGRTRGRIGVAVGHTTLLLRTRGARTGAPRAVPLLYTAHGDDLVLVASSGGADRHPAWLHNLRAHPEAEVELGGRIRPVRAREATGAERDELWARCCANYAGYAAYQRRVGRRIPVVVLEPRADRGARPDAG
ncbi:nitroreductase/quinone reductase family protein, partial [Patulibacter sp. S7RM1-6]